MKKWILALLVALVLLTADAYIFIPSRIEVSSALRAGVSENGAARFLLDTKNWPLWWNKKDSASTASFSQSGDNFICNNDTFKVSGLFHMAADIDIAHKGELIKSKMLIVSFMVDTTGLQWSCGIEAGNDPFTRFASYLRARSLKKNMDVIMNHLRSFLEMPENVYGLNLLRTSINDTLLISNKKIYPAVPNTPAIYEQIALLKEYASKNNAVQNGHPMFHVTELDSNHYELMTALPINKEIAGDSKFAFKRMIPGAFITSDVKGGEYTVAQKLKSMKQFFSDYHKTSMAIDFQMLITDRLETPDTTRWVTRLYEPVY